MQIHSSLLEFVPLLTDTCFRIEWAWTAALVLPDNLYLSLVLLSPIFYPQHHPQSVFPMPAHWCGAWLSPSLSLNSGLQMGGGERGGRLLLSSVVILEGFRRSGLSQTFRCRSLDWSREFSPGRAAERRQGVCTHRRVCMQACSQCSG